MKTCPNCKQDIIRRKNACPKCNAKIVLHKGEYFLESEKEAALFLIKSLENLILKRDGVVVEKTKEPIEWKFAWDYVKRTREFLSKQPQTYGITVATFLGGLWAHISKNLWWYEHLDSLRMLSKQLPKFAMEYWREVKEVEKIRQYNQAKVADLRSRPRVNFSAV